MRRILPALLVVAAATFCVCAKYSLPGEFVDFSKSLIAATLSASNIYFWQTSGYFGCARAQQAAASHLVPHTVEEQFCIVWPLFLWAGIKLFRAILLLAAVAVIVVSLTVSAIGAFTDRSATSLPGPYPSVGLLLGGVLPLGVFRSPLGSVARNLLSTLRGRADRRFRAHHPLRYALSRPLLGAASLPGCLSWSSSSAATANSLAGRVLAWKPIAFFGLISYSLYLWHWPLIVFQHDYALHCLTGAVRPSSESHSHCGRDPIGRAVVEVCRAAIPSRSMAPNTGRYFSDWLAQASALWCWLGVAGWSGRGFPGRFTARQLQIASFHEL